MLSLSALQTLDFLYQKYSRIFWKGWNRGALGAHGCLEMALPFVQEKADVKRVLNCFSFTPLTCSGSGTYLTKAREQMKFQIN